MATIKEPAPLPSVLSSTTAAQNAAGQVPLRTDALDLEIPVVLHAARYPVAGGSASKALPPLHEKTHTAVIFPQSGVVRLTAHLAVGELVVLTNQLSGADAFCRVNSVKVLGSHNYVGVEFTQPAPGFWGECFVVEPSAQTAWPSTERTLPTIATAHETPEMVKAHPAPVPAATPVPDFASPAIAVAAALGEPSRTLPPLLVAPPSPPRNNSSAAVGLEQSVELGPSAATGSQHVRGIHGTAVLTLFLTSPMSRSSLLGMLDDSLSQRKKKVGGDGHRRNFCAVAFAAFCLLGTLLPFIGRPKSTQATSPAVNLSTAAMPTYSADPQDTRSGQLLTVAARPGQTLEDLSLLYRGDFDGDVFAEICRLNPQLKDPNHLEPGQLIRIPLPPRTLTRTAVRAEATSTPSSSWPEY